MGMGGDTVYSRSRNLPIGPALPAVLVTSNDMFVQGFPPDPDDAVISKGSEVHAPMVEGADITTDGTAGSLGASIVSNLAATNPHEEHLALLGPSQASRNFPSKS